MHSMPLTSSQCYWRILIREKRTTNLLRLVALVEELPLCPVRAGDSARLNSSSTDGSEVCNSALPSPVESRTQTVAASGWNGSRTANALRWDIPLSRSRAG